VRAPALASAIEGLEAGFNRLVAGRAAVGAGRARLESETGRVEAARLDTAEALAAVRGVDLTAAFAELNALKLSLSAAQGSFARVYEGSLFDRLG
jgi:flagellin-like hook-associated protein FlgL